MTKGIVTQVSGSVVDVRFEPGCLPKIKEDRKSTRLNSSHE